MNKEVLARRPANASLREILSTILVVTMAGSNREIPPKEIESKLLRKLNHHNTAKPNTTHTANQTKTSQTNFHSAHKGTIVGGRSPLTIPRKNRKLGAPPTIIEGRAVGHLDGVIFGLPRKREFKKVNREGKLRLPVWLCKGRRRGVERGEKNPMRSCQRQRPIGAEGQESSG